MEHKKWEMPCTKFPACYHVLFFFSGKTFKGSGDLRERRIPLLSEVFHQFPTMPINIDIKRDDDKLIREVSRLVRDSDRESLTVWGNISNRIVLKCYQEVCIILQSSSKTLHRTMPVVGLLTYSVIFSRTRILIYFFR